jgi:hypothetical protein
MTRPDQNGGRYGGQGGVLGAQQPAPQPAEPPAQRQLEEAPPATDPRYAAPPVPAPNVPTGLVAGTGRSAITSMSAATAAATALATTAAEPAARAQAIAAAAPEAPTHGTVYGSRGPFDGDDDGAPPLTGRLPGLRIGWHTASLSALAMLGVSSPGTGLILGADVDQRPVPVRFFRPEPTRVTLVGGAWAARLVAFRTLALGATILVMTGDPAAWHGLGEQATGQSGRVLVAHGERPVGVQATAQQPVLVVYDLGVTGPSSSPELGPWQTQLTVLRQLDERGVPAVQEGHLVVMQRLALSEAALVASALRLTSQSAQLLQLMEDEMVAVMGGGADRYVWTSPTGAERRLGTVGRG